MMDLLRAFDQRFERLTRPAILAFAACGVLTVGSVDYFSGYEISMSLFYLGPVAVAAWYAGKWPGILIASLSCVSWYIADLAAGRQYSNQAIPVWNALIRLGIFLITALLLTAFRKSLLAQQSLARTDGLTGLYSRRTFEDRLAHDLASARRHRSAITVAHMDLDNFKVVNDTCGHAEGDRLLQVIGRVLMGSVREADTAARVGGDEFALVLPDTDGGGAQQFVSKLTAEFRKALEGRNWGVTFSIGVVTFLDAATTPKHALAAADELMYEVKRKGKGAVAFGVRGEAVQPRAAADAPQAARR